MVYVSHPHTTTSALSCSTTALYSTLITTLHTTRAQSHIIARCCEMLPSCFTSHLRHMYQNYCIFSFVIAGTIKQEHSNTCITLSHQAADRTLQCTHSFISTSLHQKSWSLCMLKLPQDTPYYFKHSIGKKGCEGRMEEWRKWWGLKGKTNSNPWPDLTIAMCTVLLNRDDLTSVTTPNVNLI